MGIIYIITNDINSKVYIGQTIQSLSRRWNQHKVDSQRKDAHLYRAMRKYGIEHFTPSILEQNVEIDELDILERYYIEKYDSYNNGYNSTPGGQNYKPYPNKEQMTFLWQKGLGVQEITQELNFCTRTISRWLQRFDIATQEEILERSVEKQQSNHHRVEIMHDGQIYSSIKELALHLQATNTIFAKKKLNTIIQGISDASKRNVKYCNNRFYRI